LDPGQSKESLEHGFRVTVNALFNKCLKPAASTIRLATSEIKKLHNKKFFAQIEIHTADERRIHIILTALIVQSGEIVRLVGVLSAVV
jgi:hypothetical protein